MDKWVEVDHDFIFYAFLNWYKENVSEYRGESCTPSDRYNYISLKEDEISCFCHVDFYMGTKYYIHFELYDKWNLSQGLIL